MIWNEHLELEGRHSVFPPSSPTWLNYSLEPEDETVIFQRFCAQYAAPIGTITHKFAENHIKYKQKLEESHKSELLIALLEGGIPPLAIDLDYIFPNVMNYTNDAIGYRMECERYLKYSDSFFGQTDAIMYRNKVLRIHDLKTGRGTVHLDQLLAYAALFFLEYGKQYSTTPKNTKVYLRIYQACDILEDTPEPERIQGAMNQIVQLDKRILKWKAEGTK